MSKNQSIDRYLSSMMDAGMCPSKSSLLFHLEDLFEAMDFENKSVLDIGGGAGLLSFYAACKGAKEVICLEPEFDGSRPGMIENFEKIRVELGLDNIILKPVTLQEFDPGEKIFDIVILYNSINHLNEEACINLLTDDHSKSIYREIFSKISSLTRRGGKILACDCSNSNFFQHLGIKNPFAPTIEWEKHQMPEVWIDLLNKVGYSDPGVRWFSFKPLRSMGKLLLANRFCSYFLTSQFYLTMKKSSM